MSAKEIEEAILKLPVEERRRLIDSFIPEVRSATQQESDEIQRAIDSTPETDWVDWEELKAETGH